MSEETQKEPTTDSVKLKGGIAPFGYAWVNGSLVVNKSEAPVRKLIFELFLKHQRKKTVANILNESGYRTRKGAKFSDTTIGRLLRDTTAKGIRIVGEKEIAVEPIIDSDIWERVNNILGAKKSQTKQPTQLFSGIIFCSYGGKMNLPSKAKKYSCLRCKRKVETNILEEVLLAQLKHFSPSEEKSFQFNVNDYWGLLTKKEKRIIVEQLIKQIIVSKDRIHLELAVPPNSFKRAPNGQQNVQATKPQDNQPDNTASDEPLMSESESAKFLGISKMTLLRYRKAKKIGHYRVGFRVLYSKQKHLLPFLDAREK